MQNPQESLDPSSTDKMISQEQMMKNMQQVDTLRSVLMIAAGVSCGVMQLLSLMGFVFFAMVYAFTTISVGMKIGFNFKTYFNMSLLNFLAFDVSKHVMSFILFWTLSYALVYIY